MHRFGEAAKLRRLSDADLLVENERGELARAGKLAGAAGEDDAASGELVEAAPLEALADEFERLLETRTDDADEQRLRHVVDLRVLLLADRRDGERLAVVGGRADRV